MCFAQKLSAEVREKQPEVESARRLCKQLVDATKESSTKFDLKNKLANVEKPYNELLKKIGERESTTRAKFEGPGTEAELNIRGFRRRRCECGTC